MQLVPGLGEVAMIESGPCSRQEYMPHSHDLRKLAIALRSKCARGGLTPRICVAPEYHGLVFVGRITQNLVQLNRESVEVAYV